MINIFIIFLYPFTFTHVVSFQVYSLPMEYISSLLFNQSNKVSFFNGAFIPFTLKFILNTPWLYFIFVYIFYMLLHFASYLSCLVFYFIPHLYLLFGKMKGFQYSISICILTFYHASLCYVVLLCYVMLCYIVLCYVMLCFIVLYYVVLCCIVLCYDLFVELGIIICTANLFLSSKLSTV
jgi:hypothetical protein